MGIIFAILIFSFIVFFHELGHFTLAKLNGIDVQEFAIGMGPTLFSKEYKGTVYAVHLLPIGGFCAMGEDDEETESPGNFNKKSVWARISVIAAGPIFNFIMAFVLAVILTAMVGYDKPVISSVEEGYSAAEAGIQEGDTIVQMGGKKITVQNLEVVRVDAENNLLLVKGSVPGPKKSLVTIREAVKAN